MIIVCVISCLSNQTLYICTILIITYIHVPSVYFTQVHRNLQNERRPLLNICDREGKYSFKFDNVVLSYFINSINNYIVFGEI
jgi:hypothetical protein